MCFLHNSMLKIHCTMGPKLFEIRILMDAARERLVKQEPALTEHPINVRLLRPKEKLNVLYPVATLGLETGMMLERAMR